MRLNQQTGEITIGNESLNRGLTEEALHERFSAYQLKLYINNIHLSLWAIPNFTEDKGISIYMTKGKVTTYAIAPAESRGFPPFEINEELRAEIRAYLVELGGERKYEWGEVCYTEDSRSGSVSVHINYND